MAEDMTSLVWRKSKHSGTNGACVEAASHSFGMALRDSKNPDGPKLAFTRGDWAVFIAKIKDGRLG